MQAGAEDKAFDDINITPMLDLAYVLLVIFILMCTASVQGTKVNLPRASQAPSLGKPKTVAVTVNSEGKISVGATPVSSLAELEAQLTKAKSVTPDLPVVVRGDSATQYQAILDAIGIIGKVGISEIGLATSPAK
jgi:biopolymer transport protein ExbD